MNNIKKMIVALNIIRVNIEIQLALWKEECENGGVVGEEPMIALQRSFAYTNKYLEVLNQINLKESIIDKTVTEIYATNRMIINKYISCEVVNLYEEDKTLNRKQLLDAFFSTKTTVLYLLKNLRKTLNEYCKDYEEFFIRDYSVYMNFFEKEILMTKQVMFKEVIGANYFVVGNFESLLKGE